jgi:hypothetical protein
VNYQGRLLDNGLPADGVFSMAFRVFDDESAPAGTPCGGVGFHCRWEEVQSVLVTKGVFNVLLGSVNPLTEAVFDGPDRWIEIEAEGEVMTPRERIAGAAYAIKAGSVGLDDHACPTDMLDAGPFCIDLALNSQKDWKRVANQCRNESKRLCRPSEWLNTCLLVGSVATISWLDHLVSDGNVAHPVVPG